MIVKPIKTNLVKIGDNLFEFISKNVSKLPEESVLVVTSKTNRRKIGKAQIG